MSINGHLEMRYCLLSAPEGCRDYWIPYRNSGILTALEVINLLLETDDTLKGYKLIKEE